MFYYQDINLASALSCLRANVTGSTNAYTLALLAYTFTLANDIKTRQVLLDRLYSLAASSEMDLYWPYTLRSSESNGLVSASIELSAYVLLALVSSPTLNPNELTNASRIVSWLSKQQNPYGGFSSTQDTVVAIQALAKYTKVTFNTKGNLLVTVLKDNVSLKQFKVDRTNRLLLQNQPLPNIPGKYQLTINGNGCVFMKVVLKYNEMPMVRKAPFNINATVADCEIRKGQFNLIITVRYYSLAWARGS
ncbi:alpha-2-macroglobulin-like protein 1 [Pyxicephalus adspersus]|uniref:alpha-2-macroglobulin-like protein 1 n=1 Tax=Pyxicephalus adspersus TaxID=30357 RepID=UPI003B599EF0